VQYITIVAPFVRSLWSLEAAHANASDVFVFWLAIPATLTDLFSKGTAVTEIKNSLADGMTAIYNKRYKEFFTNEFYFVGFVLDPRKYFALLIYIYSLLSFVDLPRVSECQVLQETDPKFDNNHHYTSTTPANQTLTINSPYAFQRPQSSQSIP
jgi:hypothetical protein